jgi:hypothetical protein
MSSIDSVPPLPRPDMFESGDFVWPKRPGAFVPYKQSHDVTRQTDQEIWEREKVEFLRRSASQGTYLTQDQLSNLRDLDYREFLARYHGDQKPDIPGVYSTAAGLYVGHVGIIDITSNAEINVIEALDDQGVIQQSYTNWLAGRVGQVVWLGRLGKLEKDTRAKISKEAAQYLGRPYDFWNFDLDDDSGFYCSKLAWLSIFRSLKIAIDGKSNPKRAVWFSPKQMLYLSAIDRLHNPSTF